MTKTIHQILILLLLSLQGIAQNRTTEIKGTVTSLENQPIVNAEVTILENNLVLYSFHTNASGEFTCLVELKHENEYAIETACNINQIIVFKERDETDSIDYYTFSLICYKIKSRKFDNTAYFEFNAIDNFVNFDALFLKTTLDKYPGLCVQFEQTIHPKESSKIAKQRMNYFLKTLQEIGCDMNRLTFSKEVSRLNKNEISFDQRSRISALVISMDGDCK